VKCPLAAHSHGTTAVARTQIDTPGTSRSPRDASIADFCDCLRTTNNRNGRPYDGVLVNMRGLGALMEPVHAIEGLGACAGQLLVAIAILAWITFRPRHSHR
jgi:hypothetical protein